MGKNKSATQTEKMAFILEKMRLGDYVTNLNSPKRVFWLGFLSGIGRGLGFTLGATLILALLFKILVAITKLNIPYLQGALTEVVAIVKSTPGMEKIVSGTMETGNSSETVVVVETEKK